MSSLELGRDAVIIACAISAGIHAALVPGHLDESTGAGLGFAAATVLLAALVAALTLRPANGLALAGAAAVLLALLTGYALAITIGVPLVHHDPEPVDALALVTKAIESVGLLAALYLLRRGRPAVAQTIPQPEGTPS